MDEQPVPPEKRWGLLHWLVALCVTAMMSCFAWVVWEQWRQAPALANGHAVVMALKIFAGDNKSRYPDAWLGPTTANQVFRQLIKEDYLSDERVFGCPRSPFAPDGIVGKAPSFEQAVAPGENHWMMVADQATADPLTSPIIFENALDASWPPKWRSDGKSGVRGRVWPGGKVLIFFNDNSARFIALVKTADGLLTLPAAINHPSESVPFSALKVLDIEERK
jgi:hypothetical protein